MMPTVPLIAPLKVMVPAVFATVKVLSLPTIKATKSNDVDCSNDFSQLNAGGGTRYTWQPSAILNNPNIANPVATPLSTTLFTVTGVDLAASSISFAKQFKNDRLYFYRHDMRNPFGKNRYDYVFSFFTSFGYFKTQAENERVVYNISQSLKDNGTFMMDYLNVHYAESTLVHSDTKEIDGIIYQIERWTDETHFFKKIRIDNGAGNEPLEFTEQVEKLHLSDFDILFKRFGLCIENVFGDYSLGKYDPEKSPRLIMIAKNAVKNGW